MLFLKNNKEGTLNTSILVALKNSVTSRSTADCLASLPFCPDDIRITLLHVFRKPSASEELMGEAFVRDESSRLLAVLDEAKDKLVENGFNPNNIEIKLATDPYPAVAEGIIDQFNKGNFNMVVIGRKQKSKAEEFVLGDISIKLVRALAGAAVLVVESK
ncbi:MAG: universal stress protein [Desulfobacterales bacterium]|nr:universal stress protein [Desulfobacterales bacterium]